MVVIGKVVVVVVFVVFAPSFRSTSVHFRVRFSAMLDASSRGVSPVTCDRYMDLLHQRQYATAQLRACASDEASSVLEWA